MEKRRKMEVRRGIVSCVSSYLPFGTLKLRLFGAKVKEESVKFFSDTLCRGYGSERQHRERAPVLRSAPYP